MIAVGGSTRRLDANTNQARFACTGNGDTSNRIAACRTTVYTTSVTDFLTQSNTNRKCERENCTNNTTHLVWGRGGGRGRGCGMDKGSSGSLGKQKCGNNRLHMYRIIRLRSCSDYFVEVEKTKTIMLLSPTYRSIYDDLLSGFDVAGSSTHPPGGSRPVSPVLRTPVLRSVSSLSDVSSDHSPPGTPSFSSASVSVLSSLVYISNLGRTTNYRLTKHT